MSKNFSNTLLELWVDKLHPYILWNFQDKRDPKIALLWLDDLENILKESMQCPDEDRVWIASFMFEGNAH